VSSSNILDEYTDQISAKGPEVVFRDDQVFGEVALLLKQNAQSAAQ